VQRDAKRTFAHVGNAGAAQIVQRPRRHILGQLRDIERNPPRLIFAEQLGRQSLAAIFPLTVLSRQQPPGSSHGSPCFRGAAPKTIRTPP
jgi:hypothetical protein